MARGTIVSRMLKDGKTKRYYTALWIDNPDGTRKQQWRTFEKKKDAEDFLDIRSKEVRDGDYIEPKKISFEEFSKEWIEKYPRLCDTGLKPSTITGYKSILEARLKPFFGPMLIGNIRGSMIEKDFKAQLPEDMKPATVRNILVLLQKMLQSAVDWEYLPKNPFKGRGQQEKVRIPRGTKEQHGRALTPEEIQKLLEKCSGETYTIVVTAVLTGLRRGELFGLRWKDVDFENSLIKVRQEVFFKRGKYWKNDKGVVFVSPKSSSSVREVDMSPQVKKLLREQWLHSDKENNQFGLVFINEIGKPVDLDNFMKRKFQKAVKDSKIGHCRFHDLRHTYGSLKIAQNENLKYVQRQMGHASINITVDTYAHLLKPSNREAAERTDNLIFGNAEAAR